MPPILEPTPIGTHHMTIKEHRLVREAQARFAAKTRNLSPRVLELRLRSLANRPAGYGPDEIDPIERALARQSLDIVEAKNAAKKLNEARDEMRRSPPPRMNRPEQLAELEKFDHQEAALIARLESIANQPLGGAVKEAVALRKAADEEAKRIAALRTAAEARAAEQALDPGAVDALAAAIANRK